MGLPQLCANVALSTIMAASPGKPKAKDVHIQVKDAANLSKVVRSDTEAFFGYIMQPKVATALLPWIQYQGVIQGDPHAGNVAPTLVETVDGKHVIRILSNDFDNVGQGAFVWEFVHNVIQAKAIDPDVKIRDLLTSYLDGLGGQAMKTPAKIQKVLDMSYNQYKVLRDAYVASKVENGKLKRKAGKVEDYKGPYTIEDMQALFPDAKVLDFAHRIEEVGGNLGERLWILVQESHDDLVIKELKDYQPNSISKVSQQPPIEEWTKLIHAKLWPGLNPSSYDLVTMKDGKIFWRREKAVTLMDVPRSSTSAKDQAFRRDVIMFDANFFGLSAGSQEQGAAFAKSIRADREKFIAMTKVVIWPYLEAASKAVE